MEQLGKKLNDLYRLIDFIKSYKKVINYARTWANFLTLSTVLKACSFEVLKFNYYDVNCQVMDNANFYSELRYLAKNIFGRHIFVIVETIIVKNER